jgi:hypothetical protein
LNSLSLHDFVPGMPIAFGIGGSMGCRGNTVWLERIVPGRSLKDRGMKGGSNSEAAVLKRNLIRGAGMLVPVLASTLLIQALTYGGQFPQRGQRGQGDPGGPDGRGWSEKDKQDRLDRLSRTLSWIGGTPEPGPENSFLQVHAGELLERTKQARTNNFQFDRLARAVDALLRASDRIFSARKASQTDDNDKRDAAEFLQRCYFRVQQADYFAGLSGEKESKQYVTATRSLYQQARSAYDARLYDRAQMLGDASSLIVAALENIAHASLNIPDPPVIK